MALKDPDARRAYHREYMRRRYATDPQHRHKHKSRVAATKAVNKGVLIRECCQACGCCHTQAHHSDYDQPLSVVWLCRPCHELVHGGPGCHG